MSESAESKADAPIVDVISDAEIDRLEKNLLALVNRLPTEIPAETGKLWLNGSSIALS